jgi:putative SOS response-associated peptidase YedK
MCGRYALTRPNDELGGLYGAHVVTEDRGPSWNVAPTQDVRVVLDRAPKGEPQAAERQLRTVRWGLVPTWAKDVKIGSKLINARAETLESKPSWRTAFHKRRAVIPADGYYEWQPVEQDGKVRKQPYYIHPADAGVLSFAGLYELWPDPTKDDDDPAKWLWTATIITTDAHGPAGEIHDRTPVILPGDRVDAWLDPTLTETAAVKKLLSGITVPALDIRAVSTQVNRVGNNTPELINPIDDHADQALQLALTA